MKPPSQDQDEVVARHTVWIRRTEFGSGEPAEACSVHCPLSKASVPLEHCMNCERYAATEFHPEGTSSIGCRVPTQAAEKQRTARRGEQATIERIRFLLWGGMTYRVSRMGAVQKPAKYLMNSVRGPCLRGEFTNPGGSNLAAPLRPCGQHKPRHRPSARMFC